MLRHSPSNLTELERICGEEWEKILKYRCAKLVASYLRRLEAVIAANGALNRVLGKGSEYLCTEFAKILQPVFALSLWSIVCRLISVTP
jgi:hypothetical protein